MTFFRRLWFLLTRARRTAELDEEMRLHRDLRAEAHRRQGADPREAARLARVRFGNPLTVREASQDAWGFLRLGTLVRDVRYASRQLGRRPTWTATVVATLALGVGANAVMFTLIDALLFRPGAGQAPHELVRVTTVEEPSGASRSTSYPDFVDLRRATTTLSGLMAYADNQFSVGAAPAELVLGQVASGNYFDVLGIRALRGRTFRPEDDEVGAPPVAVLSEAFWRAHFGASPALVGATIPINGHPVVVVGVAEPGFAGTEVSKRPELWMPLAQESLASADPRPRPHLFDERDAGWLLLVGRRRPGVDMARVLAELRVVMTNRPVPSGAHAVRPTVAVSTTNGLLDSTDRARADPLIGLIALVPLFVLAVACANVANLVMAQHVARQREFALRRAIGASRHRLIGQLVAESVLLAGLATLAGLLAARAFTATVAYFGELPDEITLSLLWSGRVVVATAGAALAATAIFGWLPALTATRADLTAILKDEAGASPRRARLRGAFVVAQVSLSLALLVAAALFFQSLIKALAVDPGFAARDAVTITVDPQKQGYSADGRDRIAATLVEAVSALPGVRAAGFVMPLPLTNEYWHKRVTTEGGEPARYVRFSTASPGYFSAIGLPLVEGRAFTPTDTASSTPVAIVNERLAHRLWPGQSPLGQQLVVVYAQSSDHRTVVGVAHDSKYGDLTEDPQEAFYTPPTQDPNRADTGVSLVVRGTGDPDTLLRSVRGAVSALDPDLPVLNAVTLEELISRTAESRRPMVTVLGLAGAITLLIAAIGIYGVTAHGASLRRREVGIRVALGARAGDVRGLFVRQSLRLTGLGVAIGLALSAAASRLLATYLFGLRPTDALTFVGSAVMLLAVAALASYLPARQASRVDPVSALRQD